MTVAKTRPIVAATPYLVIQPDGVTTLHEAWLSKVPTLDQLNDTILPILRSQRPHADLEHVAISFTGRRRDMFVDDFGMTVKLPINTIVSWAHYPGPVFGIAIVFPSRQVWY